MTSLVPVESNTLLGSSPLLPVTSPPWPGAPFSRFATDGILLAAPLTGLSSAGDVKVADFGVAVAVKTCMPSAGATMTGTEWYYSPEKARGWLASRGPVDMWAVGCVMLELLTSKRLGGPLWDEGSAVKARRAELIERASAVDARLSAAVGLLLQMTPEERLSAMQLLVFLYSGPKVDSESAPRLPALVLPGTQTGQDSEAAAGAVERTKKEVCACKNTLTSPNSCYPTRHQVTPGAEEVLQGFLG